MKIIGHRGAGGLALNNTLESIRAAKEVGVDGVEFDVRLTADGHFVLSHDPNTALISDTVKMIQNNTLDDLRKLRLHNGEKLATLDEALQAAGDTPVFIEAKGTGWAKALANALDKKVTGVHVISFWFKDLAEFKSLRPDIPVYDLEDWNLLRCIYRAKRHKFEGIGMRPFLLNPLDYWLARRAGLEINSTVVNHLFLARIIKWLYPAVAITTDRPDRMQKLRQG